MSTHDRLSSINRSLITRDLCQGTSWQKFNWWLRPGTTIYLHSFSNRFRVLNEHRIVIMHGFIRFHSVNSALTFHFLAGCWHTRRIHAAYGRALLVWDPPRDADFWGIFSGRGYSRSHFRVTPSPLTKVEHR